MSSISTLGTTHLIPAAIDHAPIYVDREATERMLGMLTVNKLFACCTDHMSALQMSAARWAAFSHTSWGM